MPEEIVNKENIRLLVEGKLPWEELKKLIRLSPKDEDRFWKYLEVLQQRVPWKDKCKSSTKPGHNSSFCYLISRTYKVKPEKGGAKVKNQNQAPCRRAVRDSDSQADSL